MIGKPLAALVCTCLISTGWAAESDDVKSSFGRYQAAVVAEDGKAAVEVVTKSSIAEYQRYVDLARTADRKTLEAEAMTTRLQVIMYRHRVPAEELLKLDGKSAIVYAVDHNLIGKTVKDLTPGDIRITGDKAEVALTTNGQPQGLFKLAKEDGTWRFDIVAVIKDSEKAFQDMAKQKGMAENDFIMAVVGAVAGKKVPETIWEPVK